jgi:hypothetical protein
VATASAGIRLLSHHADKLTDDGRQRLVRHGHLPEREIMTASATTHALFAVKVQRKVSNGVAGLAAAGSSLDRQKSRQLPAFSDRPTPAQASLPTSWH